MAMAAVITCGNCTNTCGFVMSAPEALHLRAAVAQRVAHRLLHEGVRDQDPEGRDVASRSRRARSQARCAFFGSLSQPKIQSPRKVDSRKKASSASIASGAPKTSPTKREYSDQFIPNWNSWTIPVTTPIAKLIRKSFPQNFVRRFQTSSPGDVPGRLQHGHHPDEAEGEGHEEEVVDGGDPELPAGEGQRIHAALLGQVDEARWARRAIRVPGSGPAVGRPTR